MKKIIQKHRELWFQGQFFLSAGLGFLWLGLSLVINYFAGAYATSRAGNAVTDLFLDNLPVWNVGPFFVDGAILVIAVALAIMVLEPRRIPFTFKSIALFIVIRSFFIALTHIGPSPEETLIDMGRVLTSLRLEDGLFFSGHTGMPFLLALMFWRNIYYRIFFLASSVFFAVITLLGHIHYSIDVFAAFFISYGIFHIARKFFKRDYGLFLEE